MSEKRALAQYGLRHDQELFVAEYVASGDIQEAARVSGRREATCREWLRNPKVEQAIQRELRQKLHGGAMGALDKMLDLIRKSSDEKVALQASKDILDRAGYKPEFMHTTADKRMEGSSMKEMMGRIEELQRELGMDTSNMVDITPGSGNDTPEPPPPPQPDEDDVPEPPAPTEPQDAPQPPGEQKTVEQETAETPEEDPVAEVDLSDPPNDVAIEDLM
jgi:hypothetical protein